MDRIYVAGPWVTQKEIDYVADAAATAWYGEANKYHDRFEHAFSEYIGVKYAMALPSCTAAIHLSLLALGIGPGDEVIVPDLTWIATVAPLTYVGATPVFADVDPKTWCLTVESIERLITPRTKAIIPVDLYGGVPDLETIRGLARSRKISVIEDAAEGLGSEINGKRAGSFGDLGVFSFHGSKTLTTGEGGMLVTDRKDLFDRIQFLRDHGRKPGDRTFFCTEVAYKYKMSALQAAFGLAQVERAQELVSRKRDIFNWYHEELGKVPGVSLNAETKGTKNSYWMVSVILDPSYRLEKTQVIARFLEHGIDTRPFFHPLSSLPPFQNTPEGLKARSRNSVSYRLAPLGINLPSGFNLDRTKVARVAATLKLILDETRRTSAAA